MLDYAALGALAAVIREGSFERAAATLGITPSAVSQRIRGLEERLGAVLVVRGQPCLPTQIGARLCAHSETVSLMEDEVVANLPRLGAAKPTSRPRLRIALNADSLNSWFPEAAARIASTSPALLDLVVDDEAHTAERLRSGDVLAAVTADLSPVQGCRITRLGALRYVATATPAFVKQYFANGVTPDALIQAPVLRFDRRDRMQAQWAEAAVGVELAGPTHWVPTTQGFLDLTLAGVGWAMNPLMLVADHLASGRLVELKPGTPLDVELCWQASRIEASVLSKATDAVRHVARKALHHDGNT
jgi:LysR family transcriptional regulator (chromosome initiation inhibitor)